MPGSIAYPTSGYPLSRAQLRSRLGGKGPLYEFLDHYAVNDTVQVFQDFTETTFNLDPWTVPTAGTTATTWAINVQASGVLRGVTGTTAATSGLKILTPAHYAGAQNASLEIRFTTSTISEHRIEMGFADALPSINTTVVNSLATPTFNTAADAAVYVYNHTGSTTTSGLYVIDSTASTGDAEKLATTTNRPVAATAQVIRIKLIGGAAVLWIDGTYMGYLPTAIKAATLVSAFVSVKANSTTSSNIDLDYVRVTADRV